METAKAVLRGEAGRRLQDELVLDILSHAPDAVGIVEAVSVASNKYVFLYANDACEALYLTNKEEMIGMDVGEFYSTRALPGDLEKTFGLMAEGKEFTNTRAFTRADGKTVWLEIIYRPIFMENQPPRWIFIARDITAKKLLQDRAAQLSIAVAEGSDLVAVSTADFEAGFWRFAYINEAFTRTTGYRPEELLGKPFTSIVPPGSSTEEFTEIRGRLFAGQSIREEIRFLHKDGRIGTFIVNSKPIQDPVTRRYSSIVTIFRDVTEERLHEAQLQYEAEHDQLTGLHNRRYFERMLADSVAMEEPSSPQHSIVFIDLDGFKEVNDRLGHAAGDDVLRAAAAAFLHCVAGSDVLVRWGGDEFAALFFHCSLESAQRAATCMLEELIRHPERRWVTASIGVTSVLPGEAPGRSTGRADRAAYAAKSAGGNRVVVLKP